MPYSESISQNTHNTDTSVYGANWFAQTFTATVANLCGVSILTHRAGNPGTVTLSIKATDSLGHPTGPDLASASLNGNDFNVLDRWQTFSFIIPLRTRVGTKYAIVIRAPAGSAGHRISWRYQNAQVYSGGNYEVSANSGSTWAAAVADFAFRIYLYTAPSTTLMASQENYNAGQPFWGTTFWVAQTFVSPFSCTLSKLEVKVYRIGLPGMATVSIRRCSDGIPVGNDLTAGTLDGDAVTIDTAGEWKEITLLPSIVLDENAQYAVVVTSPGSAWPVKSLLIKYFETFDPTLADYYPVGTASSSLDSGKTWSLWLDNPQDWCFRVYSALTYGDVLAIMRAFLAADVQVVLAVGTRVYAPRLPEGKLPPAVSFFVRGGMSNAHIPPVVEPSIQFDCWGTTPMEARVVYRALYDALQGIQEETVTIGATDYRILSVVEEVQGQDIQPIDPQGYHRVVAFFKVVIQI